MKREIRTVGYKILFSTDRTRAEIEEAIDALLKEVDARKTIACAVEMNKKEILETITHA